MDETVDPLILDLLEWIGPRGRPYAEILDVWRTSCPRLPVWEDTRDRGFVTLVDDTDHGRLVRLSTAGRAHLRANRPPRPASIRPADAP